MNRRYWMNAIALAAAAVALSVAITAIAYFTR